MGSNQIVAAQIKGKVPKQRRALAPPTQTFLQSEDRPSGVRAAGTVVVRGASSGRLHAGTEAESASGLQVKLVLAL